MLLEWRMPSPCKNPPPGNCGQNYACPRPRRPRPIIQYISGSGTTEAVRPIARWYFARCCFLAPLLARLLPLRSPLSARCWASLFPREGERKGLFSAQKNQIRKKERDVDRSGAIECEWEDGTQLHLAVVYCNGAACAWVIRVQQLPARANLWGPVRQLQRISS